MFNAFLTLDKKIDKQDSITEAVKALTEMDVLVGIPQEKSSRKNEEGINNVELAYIHTHGARRKAMIQEMSGDINRGQPYSKAYAAYITAHGSPLFRIPPRPFLEPAIEKHKDKISEPLKEAAKKALDGNASGIKSEYRKAGMLASNLVKSYFLDSDKKPKWAPNHPVTIKKKGSDQPLIDTDELRKSITFVVTGV